MCVKMSANSRMGWNKLARLQEAIEIEIENKLN